MWQRLFGKRTNTVHFIEGRGEYDFDVVGESFYQDALDEICGGKTDEGHDLECTAILQPEPENPYDPNAVAVYIDGLKVGHLDRANARAMTTKNPGMTFAARAMIVGGWLRRNGSEGHYGVRLDID